MPTPRARETQKDFVSRCIPIVLDDGTAEDSDQAAAVCYSMWREAKKEMTNNVTINIGTGEVEMVDKAAPMKTVDGRKYPAGDFLVVEDPQSPSTWHLQVKRNGTANHRLMGAAWAALHGGYRGNKYEGPDKAAALKKLVALYKSEDLETPGVGKEKAGLFDRVVEALKQVIPQDDPDPDPTTGFMLWKEADGLYHWIARYSNNFRDEDSPPEIISEKSHQRFVDLVDRGEADLPELWLWHVEDWKFGQAEWVAWDDAGFALAGGTVDRGREPLAEHIKALDPSLVRVSHGMPKNSIVRDEADDSVIVEHLTREISPLPAWAAANQLTGFILSKEVDMAIPDEKLDQLREEWHLSDEVLSTLQAANAAEAEEGKQAGIEQKEKSGEEPQAGEAPDESQEAETKAEAEAEAEPPESTGQAEPESAPEPGVSREEMREALEAIGQAITALSEQIKEVKGQVVEVQETKTIEEALTLSEIFERAIGHKEARVDGRTSEAKDRPAETKPEGESVINSGNPLADGIINDIVTGRWRTDLPQ